MMAARKRSGEKAETTRKISEAISKGIGKAYTLWAVGVMIGALGLKPTSVSAVGVSLSIEHPEVIQGVLYLAALWTCLHTLMFLQDRSNPFMNRESKRFFLWGALPKGTRSFRGLKLDDLKNTRANARVLMRFMTAFFAIPLVFLALMLVLFKTRAMASAFGALFSSSF